MKRFERKKKNCIFFCFVLYHRRSLHLHTPPIYIILYSRHLRPTPGFCPLLYCLSHSQSNVCIQQFFLYIKHSVICCCCSFNNFVCFFFYFLQLTWCLIPFIFSNGLFFKGKKPFFFYHSKKQNEISVDISFKKKIINFWYKICLSSSIIVSLSLVDSVFPYQHHRSFILLSKLNVCTKLKKRGDSISLWALN